MTIERRQVPISNSLPQETAQSVANTNRELTKLVDQINSTVATRTGTETLTNKTLTSPTINTPTITTPSITGAATATASITAHSGTAIPAGGTAGAGLKVSSTSNFGIFFGSGAPTLSAAKGSLYLRSNGSGTGNRMYVNTDGGTTWTAVTTAA